MYLILLHCYYMHLFVGFKLSSKYVLSLQNFIFLYSLLNFLNLWPYTYIAVQWHVYSGIGGESTITNTISGGDVKQAI